MACSVQGTQKQATQVNSKVKSMFIILLYIKGIVHKEFVLASETVQLRILCDVLQQVLKMFEDFAPNFDDKKTGCYITTTHCLTLLFFTRESFTKNKATVVPSLLFFVSPIEDKLKRHHFDTIEVIEAELQAVLNTLTEHDI
jgi:hypothetical protein